MSKSKIEETTPQTSPEATTPRLIRTRTYTFPDISHGGKAIAIEATSLQEATETFLKGQAPA